MGTRARSSRQAQARLAVARQAARGAAAEDAGGVVAAVGAPGRTPRRSPPALIVRLTLVMDDHGAHPRTGPSRLTPTANSRAYRRLSPRPRTVRAIVEAAVRTLRRAPASPGPGT